MKKKILHITAHMGGGVGKVLSSVAVFAAENNMDYQHTIILLNKPEKWNFIDECKKKNVLIKYIWYDVNRQTALIDITKEIAIADVVQLEWWHHPLFCQFLADFPQIPCRSIIWSHISGCYYPYIPAEFLYIADKFIFTSKYSYENPFWDKTTVEWAQKNCTVINSTGDFTNIDTDKEVHEEFNIGYIGTQAFSKLHPDFVKYCYSVSSIINVKFILVGDLTNKKQIMAEAERYGIADKFNFIDYTPNVAIEMAKLDVFSYLLNPTHFGTTENVLLEAMTAKLPVICFNQCTEKYIIKDNETGFLIKNIDEYKKIVYKLYKDRKLAKNVGYKATEYVQENFSLQGTVDKLEDVYKQLLTKSKKTISFIDIMGNTADKYFYNFLPPVLQVIFAQQIINFKEIPYILKEKNKSSVQQFYDYYTDNAKFRNWMLQIKKTGGK